MSPSWQVAAFGWPGPILALGLSVLGLAWRWPAVLVLAAAVITPFALYLGMSPATPWGFLLPVVLLAGAAALWRGSTWGAGVSVLLVAVLVASVAWRIFRT